MFSKLFGKSNKKNDDDDDDDDTTILYTMPGEDEVLHEATWLQWPHNYGTTKYDRNRKRLERYEESYILMVQELCKSDERVRIIVYDEESLNRLRPILEQRIGTSNMKQIDMYVMKYDDVWIRDNGPIFVYDKRNANRLCITNWEFNGWGKKVDDYKLSNEIPKLVGAALSMNVIDIPENFVHEGGSVEIDVTGGTLLGKKSSILNSNRNPGWNIEDVEYYYRKYLGVTNFIWLDGKKGGSDITDDHIDGTARFANGDTIVTYYRDDFVNKKEYDILKESKNANGQHYKIVHLPITSKKLSGYGDYGFYINYYVGNTVVLVPSFNDPNDTKAQDVLSKVYPTRRVVGIPMIEILKDGGMIHCITQQQPISKV